jgi:hypothetical protein
MVPPHGDAVIASTDPTLGGSMLKHEGRRQPGRRSVYAGSWLKLIDVPGRSRLISQSSSRNGENPPALAVEQHERWQEDHRYVNMAFLKEAQRERLKTDA